MHKVKLFDETLMIGPFGQCWKWLRENYGHAPFSELMQLGLSIEKVENVKKAL